MNIISSTILKTGIGNEQQTQAVSFSTVFAATDLIIIDELVTVVGQERIFTGKNFMFKFDKEVDLTIGVVEIGKVSDLMLYSSMIREVKIVSTVQNTKIVGIYSK